MLQEFKEFALKGNMVDLAIGVIIGGAFGKLVESIVTDIIMPVVGLLTNGIDFSNLYIQLAGAPASNLAAAREAGATIAYGNFITLLINFLIVAWVLFMVVKAMNRFKRQEKAPEPEAAPAPTKEEALLTDIRDLLANRAAK
ncbi:large conductance mechanosensitive channel protein MscL [Phyllobacterium sp. 21LDTY02-6]|jgi:large conductance mechanosensitive channel|uniref:large conductance mechanosensitive channel protein MscL n=1 Tax=unclassified Phyllobacterium TaxID=2638441 RepID=UPI002020EBFC|nr:MULTISPECIES: large conductance mechanosensitive channel protein MscL [unclassified Phyllobacterium]MCO4318778.1 large conductance mechanosensitive channel protein MscL [Phyllobacterium sp. 21LDTY02-6]MCX8281955.1 large conductance mechanosensitive channel protein MscL [Phyllobacterium sp. 0TCS1.6C]MCX8294418.1 large conductance mechanosensitive channel protein MscL [Phyllobacterium sp. 0TCS1.6A]